LLQSKGGEFLLLRISQKMTA